MTTMLRYVRYLRKLHGVGWKVTHNQKIKVAGGKHLIENKLILNNFIKSYATAAAAKPTATIHSNNKKMNAFEEQLKRYGKITKQEVVELLDDIQVAGSLSSLDGLMMIRSCGRSLFESDSKESIQLVQEVWDTMENLNVRLDVSHFNALLNVYNEKEYDFSSDEFLQMMKDKSVEPNRVTYQRLIRNNCRKGDIAGATKILELMKNKEIPLCEDVFNSLILGHSAANDIKNAENTLTIMENAGILPSADSYAELMYAYAKLGDMNSINKTLELLNKQDIRLSEAHHLEIFYNLVAKGHREHAEEYLKNFSQDVRSDSDCSRFLIKLVRLKQVDLALKFLVSTSSDMVRRRIRAMAIVRALGKEDISPEEVIKACQFLEEHAQFGRSYNTVLYLTLTNNPKHERVIPLLKGWASTGAEIRDHFFWPLLAHEANTGNIEGTDHVVKSMIEDFKITPSVETVRDYIVPYIYGTWENIIGRLISLNVPKEVVLNSIADRLLVERKIKNCAMFMTAHPSNYSKDMFLTHLVEALNAREDAKAFLIILRFLSEDTEVSDLNKTPVSLVDAALLEVMRIIPPYRANIFTKVLVEMDESGLSISPDLVVEIKEYLGDNYQGSVSETVDKLASGTLTQKSLMEYSPYLTDLNEIRPQFSSSKLVEMRRTFSFCVEKGDEQQVLSLLRQLTSSGYASAAVFAQALNVFCEKDNLEAAEECIQQMKDKLPDAELDFKKIARFAELLVKNNRLEDAITFLEEQRQVEDIERTIRGVVLSVRSLLDTVAETKDVENMNKIFNILKSKNFLKADNLSLGPLIRMHIMRDELEKALEIFERCCMDYRCTPLKNVLTRAFIDNEDANSLQKITDLSTEIHGESNALVDLALVFIEAGKIRQAQKIFDTPGLQIFNDKIEAIIDHFGKIGKPEYIEMFIKASRDAARMDRSFMYENLLNFYSQHDDWKSGLALWTDMQEDDIHPTTQFLKILRDLLQKHKQPVPFAFEDRDQMTQLRIQTDEHTREIDDFERAVRQKNYNIAEMMLNSDVFTRKEAISRYNMMIDAYVKDNKIDEALNTAKNLIKKFNTMGRRSFTKLTQKLIENKEYDVIKQYFGTTLSDEAKLNIRYFKVLCSIQIHEEGLKSYLTNFKYDNISPINTRNFESTVHFGSIVHGLIANPDCESDVEKWAGELFKRGIARGIHCLWDYYFITNHPRENELYNKYIAVSVSPIVKPIVEVATNNDDSDMLNKLLLKFESHTSLNMNIKATIYAGLLKVYSRLGQLDNAIDIVHKTTQRYKLNVLPKSELLELKDKCERSGKKFPFILDGKWSPSQDEYLEDDRQRMQKASV